MPSPVPFEPTQHRELVFLVRNAEAGLEPDLLTKLAEQLGAKGMDRSALYCLYPRT